VTRAATPAPRAVSEVRAHLLEIAATLQRDGAVHAAAELRELAETLGEPAPAASSPPSVRDTKVASAEALHEIHNALVGIRGHVHLLLHGPAGHEPRVRNGLEVILRESTRIEKAARLAPAGAPEAVRSS
jgi:signal transduction histidine kinase